MLLETSCELKFSIDSPTPFILMLRPRSGAQQWISSEEYLLYPSIPVVEFSDDFGNLCQRLVAPPGEFIVSTSARVTTADFVDCAPGAPYSEVEFLPDSALKYLLPSRYCESDRFGEMASEITAHRLPGYDQVDEIERWLRNTIRYQPGSNFYPLSSVEVYQQGVGVCKDLAHLGIALCRAITIPARMVVGYLLGLEPMELHAWFEAYVGGRWYTFDATQSSKKGGYVAVGYGRDAADVAVYNQFGPAVFPTEQRVAVHHVGEIPF